MAAPEVFELFLATTWVISYHTGPQQAFSSLLTRPSNSKSRSEHAYAWTETYHMERQTCVHWQKAAAWCCSWCCFSALLDSSGHSMPNHIWGSQGWIVEMQLPASPTPSNFWGTAWVSRKPWTSAISRSFLATCYVTCCLSLEGNGERML